MLLCVLGLKPVELIFCVDITEDSNFDIVIKLIHNIVRLFKNTKGAKLSIITYGRTSRFQVDTAEIPTGRKLRNILNAIKPAADVETKAGAALNQIKYRVLRRLRNQKNPAPKIVFLIMRSPSVDDVVKSAKWLKQIVGTSLLRLRESHVA